jgi:hypothetical protein
MQGIQLEGRRRESGKSGDRDLEEVPFDDEVTFMAALSAAKLRHGHRSNPMRRS